LSSKKQPHRSRRKHDDRRESAPAKRSRPRRIWSRATLSDTPLAAIAITLLVYLRCVGNGFVYDDNEMIVLNHSIGDWAMVWRSFVNDSWWFRNPLKLPQSSYYRPLQDVWLAANYHLFGLAPPGWHLMIVAVHLIAVWLVFQIARELTDSRWTPIIAATLFGVLPIHAQAVVWPTAIPLPLSAVFGLVALLFFIRRERDRRATKILAPLFYAMALLSHESAAVFPLIVVAHVVLLAPGSASEGNASAAAVSWRERFVRAGIESAPFFIELAVYLAIRLYVLGFISRLNIANPMTVTQEWLTIPSVLGTYAVLLVAPWRAGPAHPVDIVSSAAAREFYLPMLALIGLVGSAVVALWSDRRRIFYLFCAVWIAVSVAPVMNLRAFSPLALIEDRYLYMASAAWCIAVAELAGSFFSRVEPSGRLLAAATAMVTVVCAGILFHVESFWHDEVALFSTCVEMAPRSGLCHDRLGVALMQRGDAKGAEREFAISHQINPDLGANLYHLALVHAKMGRIEEALGELKRALAILPDAPPAAYVEYARLADSAGRADERDDALRHAEKLPDGLKAAELGRAQLMITHGDFAGAESFLRASLARDPRNPDEWTLLGLSLVRQGRNDEALEAYQQSLRLKPNASLQRIVTQMRGRAVDRPGPR
jgi:tetratricopeptide (TPR) repeat protein